MYNTGTAITTLSQRYISCVTWVCRLSCPGGPGGPGGRGGSGGPGGTLIGVLRG